MSAEEGSPGGGTTVAKVVADAQATEAPRNPIFAAPADDPRARRTSDAFQLVISTGIMLLSAWAYSETVDIDQRVADLFGHGLPGWISGTFTIIFILGGVYAAGLLLGILFFGHGRVAVARDMFAAGALALFTSAGMAALAGPEWLDVFPEFLERGGVPSFPVARLGIVVAVVNVARPYLSMPMRTLGRRLIFGMAIASLVMTYGSVSGVIGALALGNAAAAAIHLLFGSGVGIPSKDRIIDALKAIGLETTSVDFRDEQPVGVTLLTAELDDGNTAAVKVYGRDATDAETAARVWRSMWYRDTSGALTATGLQQVEHESLMLFQGQAENVPVPELIGWGRGPTGDSLLVTRELDGQLFADLDDADISDATLAACWAALDGLRNAGMGHSAIDGTQLVVRADDVVFGDLAPAMISPTPTYQAADVAQMFVTTAVAVGPDRAIAAARAGAGDDLLEESLPLMQTNALSARLASDVKHADFKLKDVRSSLADAIGAESPDLVQLQRVTWQNIAMVVLTLVAASALIGALSDIGFDTIAEQFSNAIMGWLVVGFIMAQLTNVGEWLSLTGVVHNRVPFGPTIMFRYALSFIGLAVPADAGSIAMNIRYMQKLGETSAAAIAQGPLLTVFSKGFDILLLIIAGRIVGDVVDYDDIDGGPALRLLGLVVVAVVVGLVVVFVVPKLRAKVVPPIKEGLHAIKASVSDPARLLRVCGGTLMQKLLFALTLAASAAAYGGDITFVEALFINSFISLFIGLIPVPGGIGVSEAAITAGLVAFGVPEDAAMAAAITHRMFTAYIPPVFGWFASRWLAERDYL